MLKTGYAGFIETDANGGSMKVSVELLCQNSLFGTLSPPTQKAIAEKAAWAEYPAKDELFRQGDLASALYILQAGRVKLYRQSKGKCQILALPVSGDCVGAESLPTGAPSPFSATTLTPVRAVFLLPGVLHTLLDEYPDFQEVFLKLITDRLKQFVTLVHDLAFRDVTSRLAMILLNRAETEGAPHHDGILFDRLLSQQEFADMVGTAREVIYRTFKRFEDDGLIRTTRVSILIRDLDALRAIALQESR